MGLAAVFSQLEQHSAGIDVTAIRSEFAQLMEHRPQLAMVDSDRGITNLHVPSDVIIDASMPAAIRAGGRMWGPGGELSDTLAMIPDRSYAGIYQVVIDYCKRHGAFDVKTMGNVSNVGLMAQKAEEYGSHDKTFEMPAAGVVKVYAGDAVLIQHEVEPGDIWRMCRTRDEPIRDWVRLAVARARATNAAAVFWLSPERAHDRNLIHKVRDYLSALETTGLEISIMSPEEAALNACERVTAGRDTISVTGNVLRDYLTDLFPILELGTSAKMLSIVPLLAGGGLFETGAGGSAPKHVQQFLEEGHLRWDSLGEFLALAASLEHFAEVNGNDRALCLAQALDQATGNFLEADKSPSRHVGELDTRGSHYYMALYWAQALADQRYTEDWFEPFRRMAAQMSERQDAILRELAGAQGKPVDIGGYYFPDDQKLATVMRPSATLNSIMASHAT